MSDITEKLVSVHHTLGCGDDEPEHNAGVGGCPRCTEIIIERYMVMKTPATRYQFMATCENAQALDLMSEALGRPEELATLVDALIKESS